MFQNLKAKFQQHVDMRTVTSVIAAGAFVSGAVFALRKVGLRKVASTVAKAK